VLGRQASLKFDIGIRRGGCPHPPGRCAAMASKARCPDEGVRAYVSRFDESCNIANRNEDL
jgi:hypothetical protein